MTRTCRQLNISILAIAASLTLLTACDDKKDDTAAKNKETTTESSPAAAQNPPAQEEPGNSAINNPDQNNSSAPVEGANSFTEGQAKSQLEEKGYTDISELKKDDSGVWRGTAVKDGKRAEVSIDFQGNVNAAN